MEYRALQDASFTLGKEEFQAYYVGWENSCCQSRRLRAGLHDQSHAIVPMVGLLGDADTHRYTSSLGNHASSDLRVRMRTIDQHGFGIGYP
jgi:hypothetical protein